MTAIGSVLGTAHYLSPEQALGGSVGPASDVYSLGLVLLEALTGARPHPGTGVEAVAARLSHDPALPDGLRPDWVDLLRGMTDRDPEARTSAADAAGRLHLAASNPTTAIGLAADAPLEPTLKMPTSLLAPQHATARSEVLGESLSASAAAAPPTETTVAMPMASPAATKTKAPARATRRNPAIIAVVVVAALLLAGGGIALGVQLAAPAAPAATTTETPTFPDVDGTLGDHLRQLQQSVAP